MFHFIWVLIVGAVIGAVVGIIAGVLTSRKMPLGWIGNILAGLIGSWLGEKLLGSWGPHVAGMAIFPSIIGAIILVAIVSFLTGTQKRE
ncbi:GlsB/YeaQ/YmgE family stress response membrane protein [Listeria aquatica]|uniref:Integral membrane protein n=1 Tax=Listeria aquatica FSL S10-1188 TaxID=1265818 RepID=W7BD04_9LIST|nr:GlsB/YeaQ/YmgE family stress response membrane protein [Listeria aquatica]EUJ20941.1 integral membrane protein [Listeria aquatica FSL S10-1188]